MKQAPDFRGFFLFASAEVGNNKQHKAPSFDGIENGAI